MLDKLLLPSIVLCKLMWHRPVCTTLVVSLCSIHVCMPPLLLQGYTLFGMLQQAGDFKLLPPTVLPVQGLQFALLMFAIISVIYIGLSLRINIATT